MKKFVYIIPCRKGSKRIINKNFKNFFNSNLTEIAINTILKSGVNKEDIYISSDSNKGENIARKYNINFHQRDPIYSSDKATTLSLLKNILNTYSDFKQYTYLTLIQPTCPLRRHQDIIDSSNKIIKEDKNSLISISKCSFSHPEYLYYLNKCQLNKYINNQLDKRSQDMKSVYFRNGAIYITRIDYLTEFNKIIDNESITYHEMPFIRSINIDNEEEWQLAELIYKSI